jgi:SnoaL-like protein
MSNREIILKWVKLFNKGDYCSLAEMYEEKAINHQVTNEPIVGKNNIKNMFKEEFSNAEMNCIIENIYVDNEWAILEWKDPLGLRGCGFFQIFENKIRFQRGYWDKLSFLRQHNLPLPVK